MTTNKVTMCFELDEEEKKQVAETGKIWQTVLTPRHSAFHQIKMTTLKPASSEQ